MKNTPQKLETTTVVVIAGSLLTVLVLSLTSVSCNSNNESNVRPNRDEYSTAFPPDRYPEKDEILIADEFEITDLLDRNGFGLSFMQADLTFEDRKVKCKHAYMYFVDAGVFPFDLVEGAKATNIKVRFHGFNQKTGVYHFFPAPEDVEKLRKHRENERRKTLQPYIEFRRKLEKK